MTRRKINLAYIRNDSMRKATFNKRKKGFFKKLNEISVLCGIDACAVVYNPYSSNPEVWPSNSGVKNVVDKFEMMPKMEQEKKMENHESFLKQNISKIMENNKKKTTENEEKTMKEAMFVLLRNEETLQLTNQNREDLCKFIDQHLKELYHHKETLNQSQFQYGESSSATNNVVALASMLEMGGSSSVPTNDFWSLRHSVTSCQAPENAFSNNFVPSFVGQQEYYPVGVYNQTPNLSHSSRNLYQNDQFGYPIAVQDGIYNPGQTQNQHQFGHPIQDKIYNPGQTQNQHQFRYPIQDRIYNPGQTQNHQQVSLNPPQEMSFFPMDDNNYTQFYHQP